MRRVTVILTGQDNSKHELSIEAASLFDAAEQAAKQVWRLWWYDPRRIIEVKAGAERWWVDPENRGKSGKIGKIGDRRDVYLNPFTLSDSDRPLKTPDSKLAFPAVRVIQP